MKALVGAFNQEKALVEAFSVIVHPFVEPMDRFTALVDIQPNLNPAAAANHSIDFSSGNVENLFQ